VDNTSEGTPDPDGQVVSDLFVRGGYEEDRRDAILRNHGLVHRIARKYRGRGMAYEDLVQEGYVGLIKAVNGYDPKNDVTFSYYAWQWITESIQRALIKNIGIRLPVITMRLMFRWKEMEEKHRRCHGQALHHSQIGPLLRISDGRANAVRHALRTYNFLSAHKSSHLAVCVNRDDCVHAEERMDINHLMNVLDEKTSLIVRMKYGLDGGEPMSLAEIGRRLGYTREWIRQIEDRAISDMRRKGSA
jgi:RNA polymerase primary sigma factor